MRFGLRTMIPTSITRRLRLVLYAILVILFATMAVVVYYVTQLNNAAHGLTETAIPSFSETADLQNVLKDIDAQLLQVSNARTVNEVNSIEKRLQVSIGEFRRLTVDLFTRTYPTNSSDRFAKTANYFEFVTKGSLRTKRDLLESASRVNLMAAELGQKMYNIQNSLEVLTLETSNSLRVALTNSQQPSTITANGDFDALVQHNTLLELEHDFGFLSDKFRTIAGLNNVEDISEAGEYLSFKFNGIATRLSRLSPNENRQQIIDDFFTIRRIITEKLGLLETASQYYGFLKTQSTLHNEQIRIQRNVSSVTNNVAILAKNQVQAASDDFKNSIGKIAFTIIFATAVSFVLVIVANTFIIEKQVHDRLEKLTSTVIELAEGNTDLVIDVAGNDELSKMAFGLKVFKANAKELRRSNKELEKFAYAAAHDLRSPIRAVQNLTEWIAEDTDNVLSEESLEYMGLMQGRLTRLDKLLVDLLDYARAGREQNDIGEVLIPQVVTDLADIIDSDKLFNVDCSVSCGSVVTYVTPLRQILLNLISNAMKHHDRGKGNIKVTARTNAEWIFISVQDDGPGIAPQHQDRVFDLFKTLQSQDAAGGSGLGLSLVQKLVEHHGGTITIESNPKTKRGTTFHFKLPIETLKS